MNSTRQLEHWIRKINEQEMPIFAATVSKVIAALNSDETSASDVAESVLSDASLTSNVLKLANTVYYNPSRHKITTITRAIMILGFEQIRNLVLSFSLIDALRHDVNKKALAQEMAYAFHAAIQAKELAVQSKYPSPEDIFIAALLSRLGELVFWSFAEEKGTALYQLMAEQGLSQREAEYQLLGFHLDDLTNALMKSWSLDEVINQAVYHGDNGNKAAKLIRMGQDVAQCSQQGWDSENMAALVTRIAKTFKQSEATVAEWIGSNAKLAKEISQSYGLAQASELIPQPQGQGGGPDDVAFSHEKETDTPPVEAGSEMDYATQLAVLQEMTEAIAEKPDREVIIKMILEGICRGLAMDSALFAQLSNDKTSLLVRYRIGKGVQPSDRQALDISFQGHLLNEVVRHKQGLLIGKDPKLLAGKINKPMLDILGRPPYVVMPVIVKNDVIGLFQADRSKTGRKISEQDFLAFQGFCQQANMGLTILAIQD